LFYYLQSIEHHSFLWGAKLRIFPQCFEGNLAFVNLRAIVKRTGIPIIMRIVSFIAAGLLIACGKSEKQPHAVEQAKWLIGSWENKNEIGTLTETWKKENDSVFSATSYFIKGKDTLHSETIKLDETDGILTYTPTVIGQNNNKPVPFKLTSSTENQLVFENPQHDYPQKIVYDFINNDSIVATISGRQQGRLSSDRFSLSRKVN